jgi:hypothetical protein
MNGHDIHAKALFSSGDSIKNGVIDDTTGTSVNPKIIQILLKKIRDRKGHVVIFRFGQCVIYVINVRYIRGSVGDIRFVIDAWIILIGILTLIASDKQGDYHAKNQQENPCSHPFHLHFAGHSFSPFRQNTDTSLAL